MVHCYQWTRHFPKWLFALVCVSVFWTERYWYVLECIWISYLLWSNLGIDKGVSILKLKTYSSYVERLRFNNLVKMSNNFSRRLQCLLDSMEWFLSLNPFRVCHGCFFCFFHELQSRQVDWEMFGVVCGEWLFPNWLAVRFFKCWSVAFNTYHTS